MENARRECSADVVFRAIQALNLEYPSHTAPRNRMKRYTGRKATEVREAGGLAAVVEAFIRRLAEHRIPAYSALSATFGSTRVARLAGTQLASTATDSSAAATVT